MNERQAIQNPLGVTVFGSAVLRVEPDIASLRFTVSRLEQHQSRVSPSVQEEETLRAFDPSSIVVRGAVIVVFALAE